MATAMPAIRQTRAHRRLERGDSGRLFGAQPNRADISLYFPRDIRGMLTPFRRVALNYIYRTALAFSEDCLESAVVSVSSQPGEEDSLALDLTMTIDADWEYIKKLRREILVKVGEWSREWPEEEKTDYGRRIYFGFVPSKL